MIEKVFDARNDFIKKNGKTPEEAGFKYVCFWNNMVIFSTNRQARKDYVKSYIIYKNLTESFGCFCAIMLVSAILFGIFLYIDGCYEIWGKLFAMSTMTASTVVYVYWLRKARKLTQCEKNIRVYLF